MEHFSQEDWVDLARNLLAPSKAALMQAHLENGCDECQDSRTIWSLILEIASREPGNRPSEAVVRAVKTAFPGSSSWRWLAKVAEFAPLKFDSFLQPSLAMVRGSAPSRRHLVHQAEPYVVDLRLESDPRASNRTFLTGQILNSEYPDGSSAVIDVVLLGGDRLLGKTVASSSGEFELELDPEEDMRLFINIRGQRAIGIALPALVG
ncbi:MAG: hypothetical protein JO270_21510 [Acidobacteriaceae bacterium]|nr:hypothetical protein [Acidobacteriaceae bacterium]